MHQLQQRCALSRPIFWLVHAKKLWKQVGDLFGPLAAVITVVTLVLAAVSRWSDPINDFLRYDIKLWHALAISVLALVIGRLLAPRRQPEVVHERALTPPTEGKYKLEPGQQLRLKAGRTSMEVAAMSNRLEQWIEVTAVGKSFDNVRLVMREPKINESSMEHDFRDSPDPQRFDLGHINESDTHSLHIDGPPAKWVKVGVYYDGEYRHDQTVTW